MAKNKADELNERQLECLRDLVRWFEAEQVSGVVVGGIAVMLLGRARATKDVDALVMIDDDCWDEFVASAKPFGFEPRLKDVLDLAAKVRVILLTHAPSRVPVDVILGAIPFEREVIQRAKAKKARGISIPVPSAGDLVVMKVVASRSHDLVDIEGILDKNPRVNLDRIGRLVEQFARDVELPDLVGTWEQIVARRRK